MKVVSFSVPKVNNECFQYQVDVGTKFYDQLHRHDEIQIMLIEHGEGTLIAGDYVGRFTTNDLYVIGSGQPHVFRSDINSKNKSRPQSKATSIYFNKEYFGESFWQLAEMKAVRKFAQRSSRGLKLSGKAKEDITVQLHQLKNVSGMDRIILFFLLLKKLTEAREIKFLAGSVHSQLKSEESKRMNNILQFTFRESHRPIYIKEVAEVANLSVEAFCRYFKIHTRKTYTIFLNEVRVSNACRLLIDKDLPIEAICYQSGFNNISNFNRIFKRITGKKPSQYVP
ncbi:MAG: helix-turn-helix domain-containing protein [Bacteroidetes bacterium]|nr:helix-turn-helix domain-containing protein [Bacteroidota bacterium]